MKNLKLKTLILPSLVAIATIAPNLTSCNSKTNTITVEGATIDLSKSHVEVDRDSTIYLLPNSGSKITGIKDITVGETPLTRMAYKIDYEEANGFACKITIYAKSMTSLDVKIQVHTTDITLKDVSYTGFYKTTTAVLNPYSLDIRATYKDIEGETQLAPGEYKVIDNSSGLEKDVTDKVLSADGYRMNEAKTYMFIIKSAVDTSKTLDLNLTIVDPYQAVCEGVDYDPAQHLYCKVKMKDDCKSLTGRVEILRFVYAGGKSKEATALCDEAFASSQASQIEFQDEYAITTIQAGTFTDCTNLETVNIPAKVTTIGVDTFKDCAKLTTVYIDSQAVVNFTTDDSLLLAKATTIYIKNGLTDPSEKYIDQHFKKVETGTKYSKWTIKQ